MQCKSGVEFQGRVGAAVGRGDGNVGPHGVVVGVRIRHKSREAIVSAAQKNHHQPTLAEHSATRGSLRPDLAHAQSAGTHQAATGQKGLQKLAACAKCGVVDLVRHGFPAAVFCTVWLRRF